MKILLASTALAAAFALAPAWAQQPAAAPPAAPSTTQGELIIQGVEPSKVLGAIDTSKLVKDQPVDAEVSADVKADAQVAQVDQKADASAKVAAEPPIAPTKTPDPNDKTGSDVQSASTGAVGVQTAELPKEVVDVIADGKYSTKDLVQAELTAAKNKPPPQMSVQPATSEGAPVFDRATPPANWSQSATTKPEEETEPTPAAPPG